jgi:hypothetical protein
MVFALCIFFPKEPENLQDAKFAKKQPTSVPEPCRGHPNNQGALDHKAKVPTEVMQEISNPRTVEPALRTLCDPVQIAD